MFNRWLVREIYYGKFDCTTIICTTDSLSNAVFIIKGLVNLHSGRPFKYIAEKMSDDYIGYLDDVIQNDGIVDFDYSDYIRGIDCIKLLKGDNI